MRAFSLLVGATLLLGTAATISSASAADSVPTRVGRLSIVDGNVDFRVPGGNWADAVVNVPVATGTALRTDHQARAEFRFGDRRIAVAPDSEIELTQIDDDTTELAIKRGRVGVELRRDPKDENVEIDLPAAGVWLAKSGHYDIAAGTGTEPTRVTVFDGGARFVGSGEDLPLSANGSATVRSGSAASVTDAEADGFADWWWGGAKAASVTPAQLHVSPEITGAETLDANGTWEAVSGTGPVWFATGLAADWAPYRDGSWRWVRPWGWSWVDDQPWGFATSHYGRWARFPQSGDGERWGWVPGTAIDHPAYAPALVGWLGTAGVGMSYPDGSGPAIAWYPLAPGEVYLPPFTRDAAAIRRLNAGTVPEANLAGLDGSAMPAEVVGAPGQDRRFATAVPRAQFTAGKPVRPAMVEVPGARLDSVPMIVASMQFPPPPAPPAPVIARLPTSGRVVALASAVARMAAPPVPPGKPVVLKGIKVLAHNLILRPAVKVASVQTVQRLVRPIAKPAFLIAAQRLAEARRHLAVARGPGR